MRYWKYQIPLFLWLALLFYLLFFKPPGVGEGFKIPQLDKVAHVFLFAGLAFWHQWGEMRGRYALSGTKLPDKPRAGAALPTIIIGIATGGFTELIQTYLPFRSGDLPDFVADILGVGLGILTFRSYLRSIFFRAEKKYSKNL